MTIQVKYNGEERQIFLQVQIRKLKGFSCYIKQTAVNIAYINMIVNKTMLTISVNNEDKTEIIC